MPIDDRLDPDLIRANLKTRRIGRKVLIYDRTSSTNDVAAEYARNSDNDGLVVFAEEQTAGRGRAGATWRGGREESLLFSIALVDCPISNELLSLTCAVSVAEAIGQIGGCQAGIKWPNDIILSGRKVAGILLESKGRRTEDRGQMTEDGGQKTAVSPAIRHPSSVIRAKRVHCASVFKTGVMRCSA